MVSGVSRRADLKHDTEDRGKEVVWCSNVVLITILLSEYKIWKKNYLMMPKGLTRPNPTRKHDSKQSSKFMYNWITSNQSAFSANKSTPNFETPKHGGFRSWLQLKKPPKLLGGNSFRAGDFGFSFDTASAGFDPLAVHPGPLQIRQQATDRGTHAVGAFNGAGIGFAADSAHSWHKIEIFIKLKGLLSDAG